jgi:hypothetical protein
MGGEGSMLHAIKTLKQNRALLKKRRSKNANDLIGDGQTKVEFKTVSPEEMAIIKESIRAEARKKRKKDIILAVVVLVALGILVLWLNHY